MSTLPTRFQPDHRRQDAARFRLLLGKKHLPSDGQIERFGQLLMQGDPLDAEVAAWGNEVGFALSRAMIDKALDEGIEAVPDAPDFVKRLFAHLDSEPTWLDRRRLERGQKAISRTGAVGTLIMRDVALMGGYSNAAINKPLVFTGSLTQGTARRNSETIAFSLEATRPGSLHRFSNGFKTTIRVRFLHALLRHKIQNHPHWKTEEWGVPINQGDMLATNLAFSVGFMAGMRVLGFRFSAAERDGIIHLWRYLGYLMGIDERSLVTNEKEGQRLLYIMLMSQPAPDEDTRQLAWALMNEPHERAPDTPIGRLKAEASMRMHNGVSRFFLGKASYQNLGLPMDRQWPWVPLAVMPAIATAETVRQILPGGNAMFLKAGMAWRKRWLHHVLAGKTADFKPVENLTR